MPTTLERFNELASKTRSLRRDTAIVQAVSYFQRFNISLDTFFEDLERLEKVSPRAAEKVKAFANQLGLVGVEADKAGTNLAALQEAYTNAEARMSRVQQMLAKGKDFLSRHLGDIGAAALATQALRKGFQGTQEAVRIQAQVSAVGERSALGAVAAGDRLNKTIGEAVEGLTQYGASTEEAASIARDMYKLTGAAAASQFEALGALGVSYGTDAKTMFERVQKDMREHGKDLDAAVRDWSSIEKHAQDLRASMAASGENQRDINLSILAYKDVVQQTREELGDAASSTDTLARVQEAAFGWARKHQMSVKESAQLAKSIAQATKLPPHLQHKLGVELLDEVQSKLVTNDLDTVISQFIDSGRLREQDREIATRILKDAEGTSGRRRLHQVQALAELTQRSSNGAMAALEQWQSIVKTQDNELSIVQLKAGLGIESTVEAARIAEFLKSNDLTAASAELKKMGIGITDEVDAGEKRARSEAEAEVDRVRGELADNATTTANKLYGKVLGLLQKPAALLVASLTTYAGGLALQTAQRSAIVAELASLQVATGALAGTSAVGKGGSLLGKAGKVLGAGALAYGGYQLLDAMTGDGDPDAAVETATQGVSAATQGTEVGTMQGLLKSAESWMAKSPVAAGGAIVPQKQEAPAKLLQTIAAGGSQKDAEGMSDFFGKAMAISASAGTQQKALQQALSQRPQPIQTRNLAAAVRGKQVTKALSNARDAKGTRALQAVQDAMSGKSIEQVASAGEFLGQLVDTLLMRVDQPQHKLASTTRTLARPTGANLPRLQGIFADLAPQPVAIPEMELEVLDVSPDGSLRVKWSNPEAVFVAAQSFLR